MATIAVRAALDDPEIEWSDVQFAAGGSRDGGHADTLVNELGLTGTPFMSIFNGCATGGSSLLAAVHAIESGAADLALAIGFEKHERGAFAASPAEYGIGDWYGEDGLMVTTQYFGMKIQRYLADHDLDPILLAEIAARALRNGALNPNAWRRKALSAEEIASSEMVNDPLTEYMFCSPSGAAQHRWRMHRQRRADRRIGSATGSRMRRPAARSSGRPPGARRAADCLHSGLRRSRGKAVHRARPLTKRPRPAP